MGNLQKTILRIAGWTKRKGLDTVLFNSPFVSAKPGICLRSQDNEIMHFLEQYPSKRYCLFGLGGHDSWRKIQHPLRTQYNGLIVSFTAFLCPSPKATVALLKFIGVDIEDPPQGLEGKVVGVAPQSSFDPFFPELIKIGYGTQLGAQTIISSHVNQKGYWLLGEVNIGREVLVGARSVIGPGVTIGDYARVNAGSFVYDDVQAGTAVSGNPARVAGRVKLRECLAEGKGYKIIKRYPPL